MMDDPRHRAQQDARARLRWRHSEDPLIVEAAECAEGWRHLTVARPVASAEEFPPALAQLFAEFPRLKAAPYRDIDATPSSGGVDLAVSLRSFVDER